jgi:hypothetical protein
LRFCSSTVSTLPARVVLRLKLRELEGDQAEDHHGAGADEAERREATGPFGVVLEEEEEEVVHFHLAEEALSHGLLGLRRH